VAAKPEGRRPVVNGGEVRRREKLLGDVVEVAVAGELERLPQINAAVPRSVVTPVGVLLVLSLAEKGLASIDAAREGAYSYITFHAMIDHVLVTTDALEEYGAGTTGVLRVDAAMPDYRHIVSDHLPVVARFAIPHGSTSATGADGSSM